MALFRHAVPAAPAPAPTEEQVKAVFVFNFSHFVEWPAQSFASPESPFVIGVLGSDSFGDRLEETVHGEKIGEHPLAVHRFRVSLILATVKYSSSSRRKPDSLSRLSPP